MGMNMKKQKRGMKRIEGEKQKRGTKRIEGEKQKMSCSFRVAFFHKLQSMMLKIYFQKLFNNSIIFIS
jgi:hypothetical protein